MTRVFYLARHGQTEANAAGIFQGTLDSPLTPTGRRQASCLGAALREEGLDGAWTSPLGRTLETTRLVLEAAGASHLDPEVVPALREIHHGDWQGETRDEVARRWPREHRLWRESPARVRMPGVGGESLGDVRDRAVEAFHERLAASPARRILVVTHDVVLRMLLAHFLAAPSSSLWAFRQDSCCLDVVEMLEGGRWRVAAMNRTDHLPGEGVARPHRDL